VIVSLPKGYELSAATLDDIPEIARTIIAYDIEIGDYSDFSEDDLREISKRSSVFDIGKDTWVIRSDGAIAALALTWSAGAGALNAIGLVTRSHTKRGLGSFLIDRTEDRAQIVARSRPGGTISLRNSVDIKDEVGIELLAGRGYKMVRRHYTMQTALEHDFASDIPAGIRISAAGMNDLPLLHRLHQETFADHWGHSPAPYEEWSGAFLARGDVDPALWFIAENEGTPIAFLIGTSEGPRGWVSDLGVVTAWRRRGVGGALLRHVLAEFKRRGLTEAGLEVDAGNETGAVRVYERVGMQPVRVYETYEKPIDVDTSPT
jgi:mycothiol synthase